MGLRIVVLFAMAALSGYSFSSPGESGPGFIFKKYSPNVALINTRFKNGTGFFITPNLVITNRHVVYGKDPATQKWDAPETITRKDGKVYSSYKNMYCSVKVDLCLINLGLPDNSSDQTPRAKSTQPGDEVFIIGHPSGVPVPIISTGIVSSELIRIPSKGISGQDASFLGFSTTAAISPGSSGSPVFSKDGRLIGIAVGSIQNSQNLNFIISTFEIAELFHQIADTASKERVELLFGFQKKLDSEIEENSNATIASEKLTAKEDFLTEVPVIQPKTIYKNGKPLDRSHIYYSSKVANLMSMAYRSVAKGDYAKQREYLLEAIAYSDKSDPNYNRAHRLLKINLCGHIAETARRRRCFDTTLKER